MNFIKKAIREFWIYRLLISFGKNKLKKRLKSNENIYPKGK